MGARAMLAATGQRELYPQLFRTYATEFNWAYRDRYPEAPIVQQGPAFTVYLLSLDGDRQQAATRYADAFRQPFPGVDSEIEAEPLFRSLEDTWRSLYAVRCLERFAEFTGIATVRRRGGDLLTDPQTIIVQTTPLLSRLIQFRAANP